MLSAELLAFLDSMGFVVKLLDEQAILISHTDEELLYEPGKLLITNTQFADGRLIRTQQTRYFDLPEHGIVLASEREVEYQTKASGLCMEQVTVRKYSDYTFQVGDRTQASKPVVQSDGAFVWPVPATDVLFVQMPADAVPNSTIQLVNALGTRLLETKAIQPEVTYPLDIKHLPKGVYFLQTERTNGQQTQKVIKN